MNYVKLDYKILNSYFYRFILNTHDKVILQTLFSLVICDKKYYKNGLLIVNAKQKTIALAAGESFATTKRSLTKLLRLGVIIQLGRGNRSTKYFIGFRTNTNDRIYLIYHHIKEYDVWLNRTIENLKELNNNELLKPNLDSTTFCMDIHLISFIKENINNPYKLLHYKIHNELTLYEVLFGPEAQEKFPLFRVKTTFPDSSD